MAIQLRCSSCQKVLQVADSSAGKKARCPGCQSMIDIPSTASPANKAPAPESTRVSEPSKPAAATSQIKVACQACGNVMQAPSSAAGKAVRCPACQSVVKVPGGTAPTSPSAQNSPAMSPKPTAGSSSAPKASAKTAASVPAASPSTGNAFWDALEDVQKSAATNRVNAPSASNPYSPSLTNAGPTNSGPPLSNRAPYYIINGIFIGLWGLLMSLGGLVQIGITIYVLANLPQNVTIDYVRLTGGIVGAILGIIIGIALVFGGIQMMFRSDLSSARNAAILAAIPCFGGCVFPFGIWAAILLYARRAERDFGHE